MHHERAVELLPSWRHGRLAAETAEAVRSHVASCEECTALVDAYDTIRAALAASDETTDACPPSEALVAHATAPPTRGDDAIARHLERCATCAELANVVAEAERAEVPDAERADVDAPPRTAARRRWPAALAAGIALAAVAYPTYRGMVEVPRLGARNVALTQERDASRDEVRALEERLTDANRRIDDVRAWSGAVDLPFLTGTLRGEEPNVIRIPVEDGQPFVVLAVDPVVPESAPGDSIYTFTILGEAGGDPFVDAIAAGRIRDVTARSGVLTLVVPTGRLPADTYSLRVDAPDGVRPRVALEARFEVVAAN